VTTTEQSVLATLTAAGLVPVVVIDEVDQGVPLARALMAGGLPIVEVTLRTPAGLGAIEAMAGLDEVLVGAGTVITPAQVDAAVAAGARYIVSPGLSERVAERCREVGVPLLPGAVTATEVQRAIELGFEVVKFFPAGTSGGAAAIKDLSGPFGGMRFVPTGGVGPNNLADYLSLAAVAAVGGSWLAPRELLAAGNFAEVERRTAGVVRLVGQIREREKR
jgi:2-dehydro-3-deoxyphosphogluconate aldolase/(4S)-4-hydroxy-2-oxoglutarate aldolase